MGSAATTDPSTPNWAMKRYNKVFEGLRDGKPVLLKRCKCGFVGIVSTGPESDFRMSYKRGKLAPSYLCIPCDKEARRRRHKERMAADSDYRIKTRRNGAEYQQRRRKKDPEIVLAATRAWRKRKRQQDPEYFREYARMNWTLKREREGKEVIRSSTVLDGTQPRIPQERFHAWLTEYQSVSGLCNADMAHELCIDERRVWSVLNQEHDRVALDVVDAALLNASRVVRVDGKVINTLEDLYGELLDDLYGEKQEERTLS